MRSLVTLAALVALAAEARADRADRAGDPLAMEREEELHWLSELVLMCAAPAELAWCEEPPEAQPAPAVKRPEVKPPPPPAGKAAISSKQAHDPSSLTADQVAAKIQSSYLAGVTRCYRDARAGRAGMRGALKLDFTVNAVGKVVGFSVKGMEGVSDCVAKLGAAWRFPIPLSNYNEPRNARFTIGLALAP